MNIRDMQVFQPFTVHDGRCILSSPEAWREPLEWQAAAAEISKKCERARRLFRGSQILSEKHKDEWDLLSADIERGVNVLVQPDPFAEYDDEDFDTVGASWSSLTYLIDRTPLLTWWIPTRHPERVREWWPQNLVDGHKYATLIPNRQNVRLGLFADIAKPADLMRLADLCGGVFVLRDDGEVEVLG